MTRQITLAVGQMAPKVGDVAGNVARAIELIEQAAGLGAQAVCLPELFNTGYFCHYSHLDQAYFKLAEPIPGPTTAALGEKAKQHGIYIIAPIFERAGAGYYYNSAALIDPDGEVAGRFRKVHMSWSGTGWEKYYFRPGSNFPVFDTRVGKIGLMICYDRFFPESARLMALKGAEIIFNPTGAPLNLGDSWEFILRARAAENQLFIVGAGLTGRVDEEHYEVTGRSLVVDPKGEIVAQLGRAEGVLVATVDLDSIEAVRTSRFNHRDRRPDVYGPLADTSKD